jgi:hypothetical protein
MVLAGLVFGVARRSLLIAVVCGSSFLPRVFSKCSQSAPLLTTRRPCPAESFNFGCRSSTSPRMAAAHILILIHFARPRLCTPICRLIAMLIRTITNDFPVAVLPLLVLRKSVAAWYHDCNRNPS